MKEYIDDVLYEASGLTIGRNHSKTCVIFGQNDEWVVLDEHDFTLFNKSRASKDREIFDGFGYSMYPKGLLLTQLDHTVFVPAEVLGGFDGRWSGNKLN